MAEVRTEAGAGWVLFAVIVMIMGGFFAFLEGLAALLGGVRLWATSAD